MSEKCAFDSRAAEFAEKTSAVRSRRWEALPSQRNHRRERRRGASDLVHPAFHQPVDQVHGRWHHVAIAAIDTGDKFARQALDGIGSGLIERFTRYCTYSSISPDVRISNQTPVRENATRLHSGVRRQTPVNTSWRLPESFSSISRACLSVAGLSRISSPSATVVSAPRTISPGSTGRAFFSARRWT